MKEKIMIAVPSASGMVSTVFMQNYSLIVGSLIRAGYVVGEGVINRSLIDKARNVFLDRARRDDCDYLFFLDDDTFMEPDGVLKLIEADKDICSPPVPCRHGTDWVNVFDMAHVPIKRNEIKGTMKVGAIGMATTLIKRKVLDAMAREYRTPFEFQIAKTKDGKPVELSEDVLFCYRAAKFGFETWVVKGIKTKHMGENNFYTYEG